MPKAKKQALTQEERLAQALVPEDEQPYEVPGNWVWVHVASLVDLHRGVSYSKDAAHNQKGEDDCLVMRGGNIGEGTLIFDDNIYVNRSFVSANQYVKENDVIIVSSTGSKKVIGRAGVSDANYSDIAFGAFLTLVRPREELNKKLIALFFQSEDYRNAIRMLAKGVNINNIKNEYILNLPFPLPPLTEQHRIVTRIENLFNKLDRAKELAQAALDSFETRKPMILHQAFTGVLTAQWREAHGVELDSWESKTVNEICKNIVDCPHSTPDWTQEGKICLRTTNFRRGYLDLNEVRYVSEETYHERNKRLVPEHGDVLYSREGAILGIACMFPEGLEACLGQRMMLMRVTANVLPLYFMNYLNSPRVTEVVKGKTGGSASPHINIRDIKEFEIPIPTLTEQQEIVRILDSLLEKEQQARHLADIVEKIDHMKKAILARAFRGELGTNDPNEESALGLLSETL